jgi:hypothetical protein
MAHDRRLAAALPPVNSVADGSDMRPSKPKSAATSGIDGLVIEAFSPGVRASFLSAVSISAARRRCNSRRATAIRLAFEA